MEPERASDTETISSERHWSFWLVAGIAAWNLLSDLPGAVTMLGVAFQDPELQARNLKLMPEWMIVLHLLSVGLLLFGVTRFVRQRPATALFTLWAFLRFTLTVTSTGHLGDVESFALILSSAFWSFPLPVACAYARRHHPVRASLT